MSEKEMLKDLEERISKHIAEANKWNAKRRKLNKEKKQLLKELDELEAKYHV